MYNVVADTRFGMYRQNTKHQCWWSATDNGQLRNILYLFLDFLRSIHVNNRRLSFLDALQMTRRTNEYNMSTIFLESYDAICLEYGKEPRQKIFVQEHWGILIAENRKSVRNKLNTSHCWRVMLFAWKCENWITVSFIPNQELLFFLIVSPLLRLVAWQLLAPCPN